MKPIKITSLYIYFILLATNVFAQSVTIVGQFTNAEPMYNLEYTAKEANLGTGVTELKCSWDLVGVNNSGSVVYDPRVTGTYMEKWKVRELKWDNTPNTIFKSIKVTLTYKQGGTTKSVTSPVYQVTVKHIGSIISMTVGGTTYSNNQTRSEPCGVSNLAVSVPAVYTDLAAAVTYTWTYPSGWSGPASTSTPSVNVTSTAGTGSGGLIKVVAKRNDGLTTVSYGINITRPLPVITSTTPSQASPGIILCTTSSTQSASATGSNSTSYLWTPTGGVTINGSSSPVNTTGSVTIGGTSNGNYNVKAYSSICQVASSNSKQKAVRIGALVIDGIDSVFNGAGSS